MNFFPKKIQIKNAKKWIFARNQLIFERYYIVLSVIFSFVKIKIVLKQDFLNIFFSIIYIFFWAHIQQLVIFKNPKLFF